MRGRFRRYRLGPKEKTNILKAAYDSWQLGEMLDKQVLIRAVEKRAHQFAIEYIDGDFQSEFVRYVQEQEAAVDAAKKARMARNGLLPMGLAALGR